MNIYDVFPVGDLMTHDTKTPGACICGPNPQISTDRLGVRSIVYVHHSLDGRELKESDHE